MGLLLACEIALLFMCILAVYLILRHQRISQKELEQEQIALTERLIGNYKEYWRKRLGEEE